MSKEKKLKPYKNSWGYMLVDMRKNKKRYIKCVHRLVAEAFIDNPNNLPEVNHIDCNRANNNVNNLEWCTRSYNIKYSFEKGNAKSNLKGWNNE